MLDKFGADGTHLWAQAIDAGGDPGLGVAFDAQGNIALAGVRYENGYAAFVSKMDPAGNLIWDKAFANQTRAKKPSAWRPTRRVTST